MSRNLLHKTKLNEFKAWLDANNIENRPGRGDWQELQIKTANGQWHAVFRRIDMPEHYTVAWPLESMVHRFIRDSKADN